MSIFHKHPENHDPLLDMHFSPQMCILFIEAAAIATAILLFA
jgi:hypothetical protein